LKGSVTEVADLFIYFAYFCFVKQRILLFDSILDGHHPDYLLNLIGYYSAHPSYELVVATGSVFQEQFEDRKVKEQLAWGSNITFLPIPTEKIQQMHAMSIYRRSFVEWNLMLAMAQEVHATHALLMYFDYFQLGAWLGKKAPIPVSGIYFRPNFLSNQQGFYPRFKKWILQKALESGQISNLFCLVPESVTQIQALTNRANIIQLCDPIREFSLNESHRATFLHELELPADKKVYLNFGHLDNRKGIEVFLKACESLPAATVSNLCLLLVGPIRPEYQHVIDQAISRVPQLQVIRKYGYLSAPEVQMCFDAADVVLLLYQGHLGSSSVLVRAAMANKLMLGTNQGQIGSLINQHQFGLAVDASSEVQVSQGILATQSGTIQCNALACSTFAAENSLQKFGDIITRGIESSN
jgi:glycosyltransferase involved in cell wall biosynthesis